MTTTFANASLTPDDSSIGTDLKSILLEPFLMVGSVCFWLVALPFVAVSLVCVKVWDTLSAIVPGHNAQKNPLILRRGLAKGGVTVRGTARPAQV